MTFVLLPKGVPVIKRVLDIIISFPALIVLSPLFLIISMIVVIHYGPPVVFKQKRPGYQGQIFTIYKFRTMHNRADEHGNPLPDAQRLTKFGRFLRATSLDELPELINVLKGEMSIVGPRPLLVEYLDRYSPHQFRRHEVLPGITGWAQVHGRNVITWQEKFDMDVWYVDNWSIWLDLKTILLTVVKVLRREGISQPGQATAEPFFGNPRETGEPSSSEHHPKA